MHENQVVKVEDHFFEFHVVEDERETSQFGAKQVESAVDSAWIFFTRESCLLHLNFTRNYA